MPAPAPRRTRPDGLPRPRTPVERSLHRERARRRARIDRERERRRARLRFVALFVTLIFLAVVLALTIWAQIDALFGL